MQHVIIVLHLMVVTALVVLVLYQKSEGGALGMGGQSGLFTGRGQANALTRATSILGTIFFLTSCALTILPAWERRAKGEDWTTAVDQSKVEFKEAPSPSAPAPAAGAAKDKPAGGAKESIFDQLKRAQEKRGAASQPSADPADSATTPSAPAAAPVETPTAAAPAATTPATPTPATPAGKPNAPAPASEAERPALRSTTQETPSQETPSQETPSQQTPAEPSKPAMETKAPAPAAPTMWKAPTQ